MHTVEIRHNFETAHRLSHPKAPLKCQSIHGHSWWVTVTLAGPELDEMGMLIEFGEFKRAWRRLLDDELDHHLVVRLGDPVAQAILAVQPDARIRWLPQDPTTEYLAAWIAEATAQVLSALPHAPGVHVRCVHVQETRVNAATWEAETSFSP